MEEAIFDSEKWFYAYNTDNGKQIGSEQYMIKPEFYDTMDYNTLYNDVLEYLEENSVNGLVLTNLNKIGLVSTKGKNED